MNKLRVPFTGYFCLILPLMVSCSTTPPPANTTPPLVVKASAVSSAASSSTATQAPKLSSSNSSSSKPSSAPKVSSSSSPAVIAKPAVAIASTPAKQSSSTSDTKIIAERNQTESAPVDTGKTRISGSVVLLDKDGESLSPEGVIINLEPAVAVAANSENPARVKPAQYRIDMRNKTYLPGLLAVKQNDLVSFVNKDNIKHNTFSSSGENTFDLGTFGPGITQSAKLVAPGIVKVYCNIHPEMATFISVSKHNYSFITQADGKFSISDLPPSRYTLTAWHIRGEVQQTIDLTQAPLANYVVTIDTSAFVPTPHKNKFGENYKVKPALFSDEFY